MTRTERIARIERAIAQSVAQDEIVLIDYTGSEDRGLLSVACDDYVEASPTITEYWGVTDDGSPWRVHLLDEPQPRDDRQPMSEDELALARADYDVYR